MPLIRSVIGAAGSGEGQEPINGILVGSDPLVASLTFDVQAYATAVGLGTIPAETGPTQEPIADQGAVGNGIADDTAELQASLAALPSTGGVLDLSQGLFGISGNDDILNIGNKSNITIKGGGLGTGLKVLSSSSGNRFDACIRYIPSGNNQNLVVRNLEIDCNNKPLGGVTTQFDNGTWVINCFIHDVGDGGSGSPLAAIKGANDQTKWRVIGNYISNGSEAGASGVRGIWSADEETTDSWIAHNLVEDTAHSGIILHAGDGPLNTIEYNTLLRIAFFSGGAGIKPESGTDLNFATFNPTTPVSLWRRNYIDLAISVNPSAGPFAIQHEGIGSDIRENLVLDSLRGFASFSRTRRVTIEDNITQKNSEYGMHFDVQGADNNDKTNCVFNNNTISGDGEGMQFGFNLGSGFKTSNFGFNGPISVLNNKIIDATSGQVNVASTALQSYVNFSNVGNGPSGAGARNNLILNTGQTPPPPPGGWAPSDHVTPIRWWDAAQGVSTSGSNVTGWSDQIAAVSATPPSTSPVFVSSSSLNSQPGINFESSGGMALRVSPEAGMNDIWLGGSVVYMWIIATMNSVSNNGRLLEKGYGQTGNIGWRLRALPGASVINFQWNDKGDSPSQQQLDTSNTFATGSFAIEFNYDGDISTTVPGLRINGSAESWSTADTGSAPRPSDASANFNIGNTNGGGQNWLGLIHELWFAQDPTAQELTDARDYITSRYGLSA